METQQLRSQGDKSSPEIARAPATSEGGCIAVYNTHQEAEAAVKQMQRTGFDLKKLSIIGRDYQTEESVLGFYNIGDRVKFWGKQGAFWGGLWGLLVGSAFFVIPGVGPLVVAGHFVGALVAVLEGAAIGGGLSSLGAALFSLGVSKNSIVQYETDLKAGKYLMIAHGTKADLEKAREIAKNAGAGSVLDFHPSDAQGAGTVQQAH
jgi:hypothetical protein